MAIQFNCPYCTASIRVADSAAGKRGTCPKCAQPLLVPKIDVPQVASTPSSAPAAAGAEHDDAGAPRHPPVGETVDPSPFGVAETTGGLEEDEPQFPSPPQDDGNPVVVAAPVATPLARALRKRRRRRRSLMIPLVCLGVFLGLGGAGWWYFNLPPALEGTLTAVTPTAEQTESLTQMLDPETHGIPAAQAATVLNVLEETPQSIISDLMDVEFRGMKSGLRIRLREGAQTEFVRVDPKQHPPLRQFVGRHVEVLDRPRRSQLDAAAADFFAALAQDDTPLPQRTDALRFRDELALNCLVGTLGHHTAARVGRTLYRCAYEDAEGRLYFLLPLGTTTFELVGWYEALGQPSPSEAVMLSCHYRVSVEHAETTEPPTEPPKKPQPETDKPESEPEMKNEMP